MATTSTPGATASRSTAARGSPVLMLVLATVGFAVNFWAWALISPLGPMFKDSGALGTLSQSDVALLVAVPVLVGSLGRIPVGALTDKYGGRVMFTLVTAVAIVPVLFIAFFALDSYALLIIGGFFLGVGRHHLRGRGAVRERVVPAGTPRTGDRRLRRRHGWHRDQRAHHREAVRPGREAAVPDHRRRARDLRGGGVGADA